MKKAKVTLVYPLLSLGNSDFRQMKLAENKR